MARRRELLDTLARELEERGCHVLLLPGDVRDTEHMAEAAREFLAWAGGADLVVANAGIGEGRRTERVDPARVAEVFGVNLIGTSNTLLPFVGPMRAQGSGVLAAVASVAGFRALPGSVSYSASKAAVLTFMEGLRMDLHGSGVHAMALCPGFVRTPLTDKNDFSMPFLMDCERACRLMVRAIERHRPVYVFPWQMRALGVVLRNAPEWFVRRAAARGR